MQRAFSRHGVGACVLLLTVLSFCVLSGCDFIGGFGKKQSYVAGKLVDGSGKPLARVKIVAVQKQPIQGYEQAEAVTGSDGLFKLSGLFPSAEYTVKPWPDKGETDAQTVVTTALEGNTSIINEPLKMRFLRSEDGVITDSATNLQWLPGPDRNTSYSQAESWVASQTLAGAGWRMPIRDELRSLYNKSFEYHISPIFKAAGYRWVWAEPNDSSSAYIFVFGGGLDSWNPRDYSLDGRVIAVRPRK